MSPTNQNEKTEELLSLIDKQIFKLREKYLDISEAAINEIMGYKSTRSVYAVKEGKVHFGMKAIIGLKLTYTNLNLNYFFDESLSPWLEDQHKIPSNPEGIILSLKKTINAIEKLNKT